MKNIRILISVLLLTFSGIAQPRELKIAFNVLEDQKSDNYEVYLMAIDGTRVENITKHKDVAWTYHALSDRLLFVSDRDACRRCYYLYESLPDGSNVKKLTGLRLEDSWMSSRNADTQLVVAGRIDTRVRYQLFLVDLPSGNYRQITNEPRAAFRDPVFSPDGKQIAYVYKKDRTDRAEIEELYVMNVDGTKKKKLTTYLANDPLAKDPGYKVGPPQWNSKYGFISYQSNQAGGQGIYAVSPDGKKNRKLVETEMDAGWHDWSPDGEWLVFDSRDSETGRYDLWLYENKTKALKKLTGASSFKYHQSPVFLGK